MQRYLNSNQTHGIQRVSRLIVQGHPQLPSQSPQRQSHVSIPNLHNAINVSQRISNVSSNKISVATRPDLMKSSQSIRSESSQRSLTKCNILPSRNYSRKNLTNNIHPNPYQNQQIQHPPVVLIKNQAPIPVNYVLPQIASKQTNRYINKQINPYRQIQPVIQKVETPVHIQNVLMPSRPKINTPVNIPTSPSIEVVKLAEVQQMPQPIPQQNVEIKNSDKYTIISGGPPLVGSVSVQHFQLPPRIRPPPKRIQNRLYRSAAYDRNASKTRPASRARSTMSFGAKPKRQILIRCPHQSFISNKKIPVLGAYICKDKSKHSIIREMLPANNRSKVLASKVIGTQLIQVIPTQIIKIPLNKQDSFSQSQNSILQDQAISITSNPILDQPTLIKQYPSEQGQVKSCVDKQQNLSDSRSYFSNRSVRLSDHIKISVYRSPSVVIKKAETITSGPQLSKPHILRIAVEGKVISSYNKNSNKSSASNRSSSPNAKYGQVSKYNLNTIQSPFNPYQSKDIRNQFLQNKFQTIEKLNLHLQAKIQSDSLSTSYKNNTNDSCMHSSQSKLDNSQSTEIKIKTFDEQDVQSCLNTSSVLSLDNLNKHKDNIPKLSITLQQKMRMLRLKNQKKKRQLQQGWLNSERKYSEDLFI